MVSEIFIQGRVYKRSSIHDNYGGTRQGGISPSVRHPYIFIFSGKTGKQHGYEDKWINKDVFSYTGEGQVGDMKFVRGNLALLNHIKIGKRVFLFVEDMRSYSKFETELELIDVGFFRAPDREGNERTAIRYFFKRPGKKLDFQPENININSTQIKNINIPNETERKGLVTSRVGQGAYRKSVLYRWNFRCAVTNYSKREILIASHIVPWKGSTNEERLDVNNSILLSPVYDALFDQHLIGFENNGQIILSDSLLKTSYKEIGVTGKECIISFSIDNYPYLERHRRNMV